MQKLNKIKIVRTFFKESRLENNGKGALETVPCNHGNLIPYYSLIEREKAFL